jgi:hypothetical protein
MGSRFLLCAGVCFGITVSLVGAASARQPGQAGRADPENCAALLEECTTSCTYQSGPRYDSCMKLCYQDDESCHKRTGSGSGSGSPAITSVPKAIAPKAVQPPH